MREGVNPPRKRSVIRQENDRVNRLADLLSDQGWLRRPVLHSDCSWASGRRFGARSTFDGIAENGCEHMRVVFFE
jgi:hypothetical protein